MPHVATATLAELQSPVIPVPFFVTPQWVRLYLAIWASRDGNCGSYTLKALSSCVRYRCRFRKLYTGASMMQPTKDRIGDDVSDSLDATSVRRILSDRNVSSRLIVVACVFREDSSQMLGIEYNQMIRVLAADRTDQAFEHTRSARANGMTWAYPGCPSLAPAS